jgi:hypothetical protein
MIAFFRKLFGLVPQTVDGIIADIEAKVASLGVAADFHNAEAELHSAEAALRTRLSAAANAEATRAKVIAGKLSALIS